MVNKSPNPMSEYKPADDPAQQGASETDEEVQLIRACQEGNLEAFDQLVLQYQDKIFGLALHMLKNHDDAQDIAQEVFISCYRNIGAFRFESRFSTWLYRVTVNRVKNRWKYLQRRKSESHLSLDEPLSPDDSRKPEIPDTRANPRQVAEGREIMEHLETQLQTLAPEYREVIVLRFIQDMQYEEIAEVLDISLGTVKSRINRARAQIREKLKDCL